MKLIRSLAIFTTVFSTYAASYEITVTSNSVNVAPNNVTTYDGNVTMSFSKDIHAEATANSILVEEGKTTYTGNVSLNLKNAIATSNEIVFIQTPDGLVAKANKVTVKQL